MKKRLFTSILSVLLLVVFALSATGCGGSPKNVVNTFFDSIDKQDVKKFLSCFEKDTKEDILDNMDEDDLKDQLETIDESFEEEYDKKWRKKIKITGFEEEDKEDGITYYSVTAEFDDEEQDFPVMKVKGKYYINVEEMGSMFGITP